MTDERSERRPHGVSPHTVNVTSPTFRKEMCLRAKLPSSLALSVCDRSARTSAGRPSRMPVRSSGRWAMRIGWATMWLAMASGQQRNADSVAVYLARTAQESGDGVSWESLSYQNETIRRHDLWDGVPGIALFLADYAAVTGSRTAKDLAARALAWSEARARTDPHPDPAGDPARPRRRRLSLATFTLRRL